MSRSTLCYFQLSEQLIAGGHLIELEDGLMMCVTCGAIKKKNFSKFVEHLETMHHFGSGYPCPFYLRRSQQVMNLQIYLLALALFGAAFTILPCTRFVVQ